MSLEKWLKEGFNKPLSAEGYKRGLKRFCRSTNTTPEILLTLPLEQIETLTESFIRQNRNTIAPKSLNVIYCAIKHWLWFNGKIRTRKEFKEIPFDKTSRKTDALTEFAPETSHIKLAFQTVDAKDQIDLGFYALMGLRPKLIPQLKLENIFPRNYTIENGRLKFTQKPAILIIPREFEGNKGNITFMTFIPTRVCELLENQLTNASSTTKLSECDNERDVYHKIKRIYQQIKFNGRPYLLRSYADGLIDRITRIYNDEDLKEFLMGHKGKISAVYQMRGLTEEKEKEYREIYVNAIDKWINENIFEMRPKEEMEKARLITEFAKKIGADSNEIAKALTMFETGKLTTQQLDERITQLTREAMQNQIRNEIREMIKTEIKNNS